MIVWKRVRATPTVVIPSNVARILLGTLSCSGLWSWPAASPLQVILKGMPNEGINTLVF